MLQKIIIETFGLWSLLTDVIILYFYAIVEASEKKQELVIEDLKSWCPKYAIVPAQMNNYL